MEYSDYFFLSAIFICAVILIRELKRIRMNEDMLSGKRIRIKSGKYRIYDGDTIYCKIPGYIHPSGKSEWRIRLNGFNTEETDSKIEHEKRMGLMAKAYLELLLQGKDIDLYVLGKSEKYGGVMANLYIAGKPLDKIMIQNGFAKEYHGGKKE